MEMIPRRKRGRPRKNPLPQDSAAVKPVEDTDDNRMRALEVENKALKEQLELQQSKEKGLTPEQLIQKKILSDDEKALLKKRIRENEDMLTGQVKNIGTEQWGNLVQRNDLIQDREAVKHDLIRAKYELAKGDMPKLSERELGKLKDRKGYLDKYLKEAKANIGDQNDTRNRYEFNRTVQNLIKYNQNCTKLEQELKNINKILDPNDPNASNLGYLEPK